MDKTCAVIVTYGNNRFQYLKKVLLFVQSSSIDYLTLVSNASSEIEAIETWLKQSFDKPFEVIINKENKGSAEAYADGINKAINIFEADKIWLLDDDNLPMPDALPKLEDYWKANNLEKQSETLPVALASYRTDRPLLRESIEMSEPELIIGKPNSYLGFSLGYYMYKKALHLFKKRKIVESGIILAAPYGGLYFSKILISQIGLPDSSYFLYGDDIEYTYRINQKGGQLILVLDSKINDLETSFRVEKKNRFNQYFNAVNPSQVYYSVRNAIVFEQQRIKSKFQYQVNRYIYLLLIRIYTILKPEYSWVRKEMIKADKDAQKLNFERL